MGKRSSLDIIATLLEAANGGVGRTRLLERANLTTSQFRKYIDLLIAKQLLAEDNSEGHFRYKTTELGLQYVALYSSIKATLYLDA